MPFALRIQERGGPSRVQVVAKDVVFIGRREDNDVVLPYAFVSARHNRIFRRDGALYVEDMGSTNGTLVNEETLSPMVPRVLRPEDVLQIERIAIQARWVEPREEPVASDATYHEPLPAATGTPASAAAGTPASAPRQPAPVPPSPALEAPATMWEIQTAALGSGAVQLDAQADAGGGTVRLGQASLPDVLASSRLVQRLREEQRDSFGLWVLLFKALGLLAVLAGIVLLVVVLLA